MSGVPTEWSVNSRNGSLSTATRVVLSLAAAFGLLLGLIVTTGAQAYAATSGLTVAGGNGAGSAANQLALPLNVAVDADGNVYVADASNDRVQKWAPGASSGVTVAGGNGAGSAANQLENPQAVAVDADGNVYVADGNNNRVQEWAPGASSGVTVAGGNGAGSAANQLFGPWFLAVDADGNVYVTDGNNRVQEWAPGASYGVTVAGGNGRGSAANQLADPRGVAVDADGNLYVADAFNQRVQEWAPGASSGVTVAGGNGLGSAANQLFTPSGVAVDADGNVYLGDTGNNRVQEWAPGASSGVTVAGGNGAGSAANQLFNPVGVAVDASGNIFVADFLNYRVQEWWTQDRSPAISGASDVTGTAESGRCSAQVANPVTVTANPGPTVTYNGGAWPGVFPVGTTPVSVHAANLFGSADTSFNVTVDDSEAPTITTPANMTVNATSPTGTTVNYPPFTASDNCPGVTLGSTPASGSLFPIGTTTVYGTATDASNNQASASFTVTVLSAAQQITNLANAVVGQGPGGSLSAKVSAIQNAPNNTARCKKIGAFINEVNAQTGKKITAAQAQAFLSAAADLKGTLGC